MSLWEKIKSIFSGGIETISDKTSELSHLIKLRWEHHTIKNTIEKHLNEFGGKVYQFHVEQRETALFKETNDLVAKIKVLEEHLQNKDQEIKEFMEKGVDRAHLKKFRKDLELGDGKIEQVVLDEHSKIAGKIIKELNFPKNVLVGAIVRDGQVIIPDGNTMLKIADKVTLLGEKEDVHSALGIFE